MNISGTQIGGSVTLAGSSSKGAIAAANTQIAGDLQFDENTHLDGAINLGGLRLGGSLKMSRAPFGGEVTLRNAHIVGDAVIKGAGFAHGLNIRAMQVGGDLLLQGAHLAGDLLALNLDVRRDLLLDGATFDGAVNLFDGRVANSVHMEHADFQKELSASSIQVAGDMRLDDARFATGAVLARARVSGDLNLTGASINGLDLTRATIGGALEVDARTTWLSPSRFSLVNATVGRLQDGPVRNLQSCPSNEHPSPVGNGWPTGRTMELEGFTYGHLGSSAGSESVDMRERDVCWWRWWLERDAEFSSQPYVQLAAVMAAHGDQDNAARILYFGRVRETQMAWEEGNYLRWMLLATLSIVTGYGIGTYTFRVLLWIVGLTVIGVIVLKRSPAAGEKTFLWRTGASLSRVLPGIEINKEFSDFFDDPNRQRLKDWQIVLFSAFVMIGWVLGLFLVAAMTGLTQHS